MGVGYPLDLLICSCMGVDMYDCVWPTRTARFGTAITKYGTLINLKQSKYKNDTSIIEENCNCLACSKGYSKAYLHTLVTKVDTVCHYISIHNLTYMMRLMKEIRQAIINDTLPQYCKLFLEHMFGSLDQVPTWVKEALTACEMAKEIGIKTDYSIENDEYFKQANITKYIKEFKQQNMIRKNKKEKEQIKTINKNFIIYLTTTYIHNHNH